MNGFQGIAVCAFGRSVEPTLNPMLPYCVCRMDYDAQNNLVVRTIESQHSDALNATGIATMYNDGCEDAYYTVIEAVGANKAMLDAVWARQQG